MPRFTTIILFLVPYAFCVLTIEAQTRPSITPEQAEAIRQSLALPPGTKIEIDVENVQGGRMTAHDEGTGVGAGAKAIGDKLSDSITGTAPTVGLGKGRTATGGAIDRETTATATIIPAAAWANPLFWVGIACILGAGACVYFTLTRAAMILAVAGVGLLAAAFYPAILLFAAAAVALVVAGPYIYAEYQNLRHKEALRAVVAGVGDLPPETANTVKASISAQADAADKKTISEIKFKDGIH